MTGRDTEAIDADPAQGMHACGVKLSRQQGRRVQWLSQTAGPLTRWSDRISAGDARTIVVIDPPTGTGAELLYGSLGQRDVVLIPFGENPAFDFLKSKLAEFGTVGASAEGPHQLWWGGLAWPISEATRKETALRIVSCHSKTLGDLHTYHLRHSLERLGLAFDIEAIECRSRQLTAADKAGFVARMWQRHGGRLLYVDPDVMFQALPNLVDLAGCDFAVHKWNGWEMSARTLYFGASRAAATMLRTWQEIASSYPDVWDGYLIDQAWSAVSSQIALDTVWLPRSYHAIAGEAASSHATIVHNLKPTISELGPNPEFSAMVRSARRSGRAGPADSLLVVGSDANSDKVVTVVLRDEAGSVRAIADSIDALTRVFTARCGGSARLELSLCGSPSDVRAAREAAARAGNAVVELMAGQALTPDLFQAAAAADATRTPTNIKTARR
ncbi:conserved hypothetical protein [Bradyrhizobium sp. ORS 375]|nr:hypothetical protein [Bradyrhizobium sp. ORS 375]CCD97068.1 conserved hypothetical protein [Bradyrhizobium sp. ORS 375]